jgi:LysM repeat protein
MRFNEFKTLVPHSDSMGPGEEIVLPSYVLVKRGNTLSKIADKLGIPLPDLIAANPQIKDPNLIHPGDKIKIPSKTPDTPTKPAEPEIDRGRPTMKDDPRLKPNSPETPVVIPPGSSTAGAGQGNRGMSSGSGAFKFSNVSNAKTIFDHFKNTGFNDIQSAAWVGNFYHESKANPEEVGDLRGKGSNRAPTAFGIAQWRLDRLKKLKDTLGDKWNTLSGQLKWATFEITHVPQFIAVKRALHANANNLEKCVEIIQDKFEIPDPVLSHYENRLGFARSALKLFGTEQPKKPA